MNDPIALDQGQVGSCTGNAVIGALSTEPFSLRADEPTALSVYVAATKLDNGCACNSTAVQCPAAYNPTSGANDNGSTGVSALSAALNLERSGQMSQQFTTYSTADTFAEMLSELDTKGPCVIGTRWYDSMMQTTGCGHLEVDFDSAIDGGHERAIVAIQVVLTDGKVDATRSMVWEMNSWGNSWGACVGSRCGYQSITFADEEKLLAQGGEIDCPDP